MIRRERKKARGRGKPFLLTAAAWVTALALLVSCAAGLADLPWPEKATAGQTALKQLIDRANEALTLHGQAPFNSLFECWEGLAVLGITDLSGADHAEGVELTATLNPRDVDMLELRCDSTERFAPVCAALITACAPGVTWEQAIAAATGAVTRVGKHPNNSFRDTVDHERGETVGIFFAYEINPYNTDPGVNWLTATLIPPMTGSEGSLFVTPEPIFPQDTPPPTNDDGDSDWVGYFPELDDADHFEVFVTATPEPDSPVYPYV
ncbi:MAG: hypothetical protein IKS31_08305 [Clostridia bacterium]|nr:hypothetical protein [Clostridia bacterium]